MSVIQHILEAMEQHGSQQAFCIEDQHYTYRELASAIAQIQQAIQVNIPETDLNIGLMAHNDLYTYASIIALWLEGKAYVPLNPQSPITRNEKIVEQAQVHFILDASSSANYNHVKRIDTTKLAASTAAPSLNNYASHQLAYIFFTSGTTGTPKGVPITHSNLNAFTEAFWQLDYPIEQTDRCLQMFDLTFDLSVVSLVVPLIKGACVYTVSHGGIKYLEVLKVISTHQLTFTLMVPSILHGLRPFFKKMHLPHLKLSMFCGEALHLDVTKAWSLCAPHATIANVYGPTECTIYCTNYTYNRTGHNKAHNGILSIGTAMANTKTCIVDANNKPLKPHEEGELCLSGDQLTAGYWNNPALNEKAFFNHAESGVTTRYYKTGDRCIKDADGNILYLGRLDFQAKVQGYRVELSEIEFFAKRILKNMNIVALIITNKSNNNEVAMAMESPPIDTEAFIENMKTHLPSYMIPNKIKFYKSFPLNANGKTDRKAITQQIETQHG